MENNLNEAIDERMYNLYKYMVRDDVFGAYGWFWSKTIETFQPAIVRYTLKM